MNAVTSVLGLEFEGTSPASTVDLVNQIINYAQEQGASDIHLDPQADFLRVRLRIDGRLEDAGNIARERSAEIISRIKIMSGLPTDEHRKALDGRFRIALSANELLDIRVSIAPTYYGENAVLRLLSAPKGGSTSLASLGFAPENIRQILRAVFRPYGMILVTGPTGSGKTTTLYALLEVLNKPETSVVTIEDPIEYAIAGIEQIQVNLKGELNFANGLRSILRQDPNIIMVGEIRDTETAAIAVNASLTGHLLLSTLHTNDAATTLPRLLDMKVESYLIASTVNLIIGQRLVRKICEACKWEKNLEPAELKSLQQIFGKKNSGLPGRFYIGRGCGECRGSGYKGRIGVHEVLPVNKPIREAILQKKQAGDIQALAVKAGMSSLSEDALEKAGSGVTSIEEVLRMLHDSY